jgi:sulfur transfer complex TusBCD TusB component (DsrH family)
MANDKLIFLIQDLYVAVEENRYFDAIEINEQITKILKTYRYAC